MPTISLYRIPDSDLTNDTVSALLDGAASAEIPVLEDLPARLFIFRDPEGIPEVSRH